MAWCVIPWVQFLWELSELPGLPGSLFPSPDWRSFPSLFFQITFNFLLFLSCFWHPYDLDVGTFKVVLEVRNPLLIFLNSCFFILFWLNVYFFLLLQIIDLSPSVLPFMLVLCIFFFGIYIYMVSSAYYVVRGGALGIHQGRATHSAALWCCGWGRGLRENNAICSALCWLSVTSPATHKQI